MALADDETDDGPMDAAPRRGLQRKRWRALLAFAIILFAGIAVGWISRERIATNIIESTLKSYDLDAQYKIESIGPDKEVLRDVVIGDPLLPDLTIERVTVTLRYGLGAPTIGRVTLEQPRLFGSFRNGALSFGSLDKALFRKTGQPPGLPKLDIDLVDGRALMETDYGPVGLKAAGEGQLYSGFVGTLAATAPDLDGMGCGVRGATLYGRVTTSSGKPHFTGPLRMADLECAARGVHLEDAGIALDAGADADFSGFDGKGSLASGAFEGGGVKASGLNGTIRANWRDAVLNAHYSLVARGLEHPQARFAVLTAEGGLRTHDGFDKVELDADVEGNGLRIGDGMNRTIASLGQAAQGTLARPLLDKLAGALRRESRASSLSASLTFRKTGSALSLVVPQASLRGGSGAMLLALSRVQLGTQGDGSPRLAGNFATGGEGMPQIVGRMERAPSGRTVFRLRMADYAAGDSHLAIPELVLAQGQGGRLGFAGKAEVSGPLPGGSARNLVVPLSGNYDDGRLALWRQCTDFSFDRLAVASLVLEHRGVDAVPEPRRADPCLWAAGTAARGRRAVARPRR